LIIGRTCLHFLREFWAESLLFSSRQTRDKHSRCSSWRLHRHERVHLSSSRSGLGGLGCSLMGSLAVFVRPLEALGWPEVFLGGIRSGVWAVLGGLGIFFGVSWGCSLAAFCCLEGLLVRLQKILGRLESTFLKSFGCATRLLPCARWQALRCLFA